MMIRQQAKRDKEAKKSSKPANKAPLVPKEIVPKAVAKAKEQQALKE